MTAMRAVAKNQSWRKKTRRHSVGSKNQCVMHQIHTTTANYKTPPPTPGQKAIRMQRAPEASL
jgi:hypothetical protein